MRNCIKADVRRVQSKRAYFVCITIMIVLIVLSGLLEKMFPLNMKSLMGEGNSASSSGLYTMVAFLFFSLLVGIPIYSAIFSDDFKSRSMQTAIGFGLTRDKLIFARFLECLFLLIETGILFSIALLGTYAVFGLDMGVARNMLVDNIWITDLKIFSSLSISMIVVYGTQKSGGGLIVCILLLTGVLNSMLSALDMIPFLSKNNITISKYLPDGMISSLSAGIKKGDVGAIVLSAVAFVICYIGLPLFLSIWVFKNKELDF